MVSLQKLTGEKNVCLVKFTGLVKELGLNIFLFIFTFVIEIYFTVLIQRIVFVRTVQVRERKSILVLIGGWEPFN